MLRSARHFVTVGSCLAVLALFATSSTARAGLVTYSSMSSWEGAVSGVTTVTIPNLAPDSFVFYGSGTASVTYSPLVFSTSASLGNGNFFNVGMGYFGAPAAVLSDQVATVGVENILITFPTAVTGFALNFGTFNGSNVTFTVSNGDSVTEGTTGSDYAVPQFLGATDTTPFTSVLVTSPDYVLNINNVSFGSAIPEPASVTLLAAGTAALGGAAWRRRRKTTRCASCQG
jgi:hypothetical protein